MVFEIQPSDTHCVRACRGSIGGVSHATAVTFGWLAGTIAATGEFPAEKTEIK